jgi:hypothetical protein
MIAQLVSDKGHTGALYSKNGDPVAEIRWDGTYY